MDALYKMPTHGSKKVKSYSTGSGIQEIAKNSLLKNGFIRGTCTSSEVLAGGYPFQSFWGCDHFKFILGLGVVTPKPLDTQRAGAIHFDGGPIWWRNHLESFLAS